MRRLAASSPGRRRLLAAGVLGLLARHAAGAEPARALAIVYPEIGEPYRSVFAKIIEGIDDQAKARVARFAVGGGAPDLATELRRHDVRVVIALGRNGLKAVSALEGELAIVAGGVLSVPEADARGLTVHSLAPDPALLFAKLKSLMPAARRLSVVHDPRQNAWLMRRAREAARQHSLELQVHEADDLKGAIRFYQDFFAAADAKRDVLWLPQDTTTVEDSAVLPLVLQESWNRSVAVFSSSVAHVKRGALFSLYPNNLELGRSLANSALAALASGPSPRGVQPLRDVLVAVNVRTAAHLGIALGGKQQAFDLIFPEP